MSVVFAKQPLLRPVEGPDRDFLLEEDFPFLMDGQEFIVPKTFITDLASVPCLFEEVIDNDDPKILRPSIVHDWLYTLNGSVNPTTVFTRKQCDQILSDGMSFCGADWFLRMEVYGAVEAGGWVPWNRHSHKLGLALSGAPVITYRATSFAGPQDLRAYIKCRDSGGSGDHCLSYGDNGEGAWGDETWVFDEAIVALPRAVGSRGRKLSVTLNGVTFQAVCKDISPVGVIDLNPGSLIAAGLDPLTELDTTAQWQWT